MLLLLLLIMIPFFVQALRFNAGKIPLLADKNRRILHQFVFWSRPCPPFDLRVCLSIWLYKRLQWDADGWQPKSADLQRAWQQTPLSVSACCCKSTDVHYQPPPTSLCCFLSRSLSRWGISVSVSGCTDADLSLLEARREPMVISLLLPSPQPKAHDFLCGAQAPFVMPQVTPDPLALPPPGRS